jgi:dipeptidyl aminopeptidase/acylaminoacyl peptidase
MTRQTTLSLVLVLMSPILAAGRAGAQPHPFNVRDLVAMDRVSQLAASPDGSRVVFVISALDATANRRRSDLWIVNTDGTGLKQLTTHEANDTNGTWSPDGRSVYFLSNRSGLSQVWRVAAAGGEAEQVTKLPIDIGTFVLSPDGSRLAASLEVFVDCDTVECTSARVAANQKKQATGRIYDQLLYRHWDAWSDGRRSHLVVVPVGGGAPMDVMRGLDADAPSKPFGGAEEFTFTPDGRSLVFATKDVGREEAWSTNFDLFVAPVDGSAKPKSLTSANPAWDTGPVFSPDGRTLAYRAMARPGFEADRWRIVLRDWPEGRERVLTQGWDRSPEEVVWSPDGKTVYATAENLGHKSLFAVDAVNGEARVIVKDGHIMSPAVARDRLVVAIDTLRSPADIYTLSSSGADLRAITRVNAARLQQILLGEPEQFTFTGAGGDTVHGWLVKPVNFDPSKRYPMAFLIHGGPQGSFGNDFHYRWNPQTYAAAGYAAVMIDFHGSTGYGQPFTDAIRDDWGGKPLEDLQKGFDAALAKWQWIDGDRACALGASYGGYMINWIAGAWPDRFRCLVSHDGNLDERFAYYATEELWFPEWEHGGTPWDNPEGYEKHNPANHVARWKTPMLVIHGGLDYRISDSQGMATFTALQRRGIPSRFLYFPDENHWVLKPANSILWHDTVIDWLNRWTRAPSSSGE